MDEDVIERLSRDPRYHALVRRRSVFGWTLAALVFAAFTGFTLLIAFNKPLLARPIGDGVTSLGVPIGMGLILFAVALTALYVARCNGAYDREMADLLKEARA